MTAFLPGLGDDRKMKRRTKGLGRQAEKDVLGWMDGWMAGWWLENQDAENNMK